MWCCVDACVCWRGQKNYKKRDNIAAVDDLPISRKIVRGAVREDGLTSWEKIIRTFDDAMTHVRRAQVLLYFVKQLLLLLLYIPAINNIIRVRAPKKGFTAAAAVDTRIAALITSETDFCKC